MRVSVFDHDPGFTENLVGIEVTFNGARVEGDCYTADEETGYIEMAARDANGNLRLKGDSVVLEKRIGKVTISVSEGWAH